MLYVLAAIGSVVCAVIVAVLITAHLAKNSINEPMNRLDKWLK